MHFLFEAILVFVFSSIWCSVYGYIPAQPSNDTSRGINTTNSSKLHLQWYPNGSDWEFVSYQLVGAGSNGTTKGALVHFTENLTENGTTTTPWIALVSCDYNATNYSEEVDIITMASDRGAQSALLYSLYSETCAINQGYATNFDQVFDIFATQSLSVSRMIEHEFEQIGSIYSSALGDPVAPGYLIATLQAWNATGTHSTGSSNPYRSSILTSSSSNQSSNSQTSLAMIILFLIVGCVVLAAAIVKRSKFAEFLARLFDCVGRGQRIGTTGTSV